MFFKRTLFLNVYTHTNVHYTYTPHRICRILIAFINSVVLSWGSKKNDHRRTRTCNLLVPSAIEAKRATIAPGSHDQGAASLYMGEMLEGDAYIGLRKSLSRLQRGVSPPAALRIKQRATIFGIVFSTLVIAHVCGSSLPVVTCNPPSSDAHP